MDFKNKVMVITGGANGIGRRMVTEFSNAGAKVAFIDTDEAGGKSLLTALNDDSLFYAGDLASEQVLNRFADAVIGKYGRIDYLINNACLSRKGILSGCGFDDFNDVLKVGVTAPYMLAKLFLPHFNIGASVVNISSTRALMSQADTESYTAAKGGITALTHALAVSLAGKVRINCILPGWIDTTGGEFNREDCFQHPVGRIGDPIDIVKAVQFLLSDDAGFINGQSLVVDGGMTKLMIYHNDEGWVYKP